MADFRKYERLKEQGVTAIEVWRRAESDGLGEIVRLRLIRQLFGLSLVEAKEVSVQARTGQTLLEHQSQVAEELEKALRGDE